MQKRPNFNYSALIHTHACKISYLSGPPSERGALTCFQLLQRCVFIFHGTGIYQGCGTEKVLLSQLPAGVHELKRRAAARSRLMAGTITFRVIVITG